MWACLISSALRLRGEPAAATAIEYALIASLVAGAAMAGMIALGISLELLFSGVSDHIVTTGAAIDSAGDSPGDPPRCVEVASNCPK